MARFPRYLFGTLAIVGMFLVETSLAHVVFPKATREGPVDADDWHNDEGIM